MIFFVVIFVMILELKAVVPEKHIKSLATALIAKDVKPDATAINRIFSRSLMHCSMFCNMNSKCQSFTFNQNRCEMYEEVYSVEEPIDLVSYQGFTYYAVLVPESIIKVYNHHSLDWNGAIQFCKKQKRELVSIVSEEIYNQVIEAMKKVNFEGKAWIGLIAVNRKGDFRWLTGQQFHVPDVHQSSKDPFYIWNPGMTVDYQSMDVAVVMLGSDYDEHSYYWADEMVSYTFDYSVCKIPD